MPWITPIADTKLKLRPVQSAQLGTNEKRDRAAGDRLAICGAKKDGAHWRVKLAGPLTIGGAQTDVVWIWPDHWQGVGEVYQATMQALHSQTVATAPSSSPGTFKSYRRDGAGMVVEAVLNIKYRSQTDNAINPGGACNVTSFAIGMDYLGIDLDQPPVQGEDFLYEWMTARKLSRHEPLDLQLMAQAHGAIDHYTAAAKIPEIKAWIAGGRPVIVHGYFTTFGHIVVLVGYDETGFIVHDPYGEWAEGYGATRNNAANPDRGKYIHYSYGLIDHTCLPDGGCWAHFLDRAGWGPSQSVSEAAVPKKHPPQSFRLNSIATAMIKSYEGLDLEAYPDTEGIPTIGIGTTVYPDGRSVKLGDRCTEVEALAYFDRDIDRFIAALRSLTNVSLTGRQIAALTSFIYNVGIGSATDTKRPGFTGSTLRRLINESATAEEIQIQLRRWTNDRTPGLVSRRESECELWTGGDWEKWR